MEINYESVMSLDNLIAILTDARNNNGNMVVNICVNGRIYEDIDVNCTDNFLYLEGYEK